jgi:anti-sigma28 factor (negative regulator of flagellin synthesis)
MHRIEQLRQQIENGTYRPVPARTAAAVLASGDLF